MGYSIGGVADKLDLSPHTLRYYEKEGLIPPVSRAGNGRRVYSKEDLNWIQMVQCLRKTGMSVALIKEYIELESADGDSFASPRASAKENDRKQNR